MKDTEFKTGVFENGLMEKCNFNNGTFNNGTFKNSVFKYGNWKDGTWENSTWKEGYIWSTRFDTYLNSKVNPIKFKEFEKTAKDSAEFLLNVYIEVK